MFNLNIFNVFNFLLVMSLCYCVIMFFITKSIFFVFIFIFFMIFILMISYLKKKVYHEELSDN